MLDRTRCRQLGEETVQIIERRGYANARGEWKSIAAQLGHAVAGTVTILPHQLSEALEAGAHESTQSAGPPSLEVTAETTIQASRRLVAAGTDVLALNFASAKNPGGGFLGGSRAQEESLARSSGLYACLRAAPGYYQTNRNGPSGYYTDAMIYSPGVPVFRNDDGGLLDDPFDVSFITAPAANVKALRQHGRVDQREVLETMRRRVANVLRLAAARRHETLVLGAWGCGAFGNDPAMIARLFREALASPIGSTFRNVTFAVFDHVPRQPVLSAFRAEFAAGLEKETST